MPGLLKRGNNYNSIDWFLVDGVLREMFIYKFQNKPGAVAKNATPARIELAVLRFLCNTLTN